MRRYWLGWLLLAWAGCVSGPEIPESLEPQIDKSVTFTQVLQSPEAYTGRTVVVGGEVLSARGLKEGTQLEVLQLPLGDRQRPAAQRTESQGRFLALSRDSVDPAKFADGTPVTIVGEVTGAQTGRLDETDYRYPTLDVKYLYVWDKRREQEPWRSGPRFGVFGGVGMGGGGTVGGGGVGIGF